MSKTNHKKTLSNRANWNGETEKCNCLEHSNEVIFALRDNHGNEFSLDLTTVLQCLKFAEKQGELPEIDQSWWGTVERMTTVGII